MILIKKKTVSRPSEINESFNNRDLRILAKTLRSFFPDDRVQVRTTPVAIFKPFHPPINCFYRGAPAGLIRPWLIPSSEIGSSLSSGIWRSFLVASVFNLRRLTDSLRRESSGERTSTLLSLSLSLSLSEQGTTRLEKRKKDPRQLFAAIRD